ncbi:MAG TPA: hypothetical protein VHW44_15290 [Pseudonocardiaceae bacterium]|nr:hypothetical protein [Pseudonocardiaceae bacterium]
MDDQTLAELFRAAAADPPPATFDEQDVLHASRRITARRRSLLAGGSAFGGLVLVVGLVIGLGDFGHTNGETSASAGSAAVVSGTGTFAPDAPGQANGPGRVGPMVPNEQMTQDFPVTTPMQGGGPTGGAGKTGSALSGCGPTDGQLAVALAGELPSVGAENAAGSVPVAQANCPAGARAAGFQVHQGSAAGLVGAVLLPAGEAVTDLALPAGAVQVSAPSAAGGQLVVFSRPNRGATAPYVDQLHAIALALAAEV